MAFNYEAVLLITFEDFVTKEDQVKFLDLCKKRIKEEINAGKIICSSFNLDLSSDSIEFTLENSEVQPYENAKPDIGTQFQTLAKEFSDLTNCGIFFNFIIKKYTTSGMRGYGWAFFGYDMDGDSGINIHDFFLGSKIVEEADKQKAIKKSMNGLKKYLLKYSTSENDAARIVSIIQSNL